MRAKQVDWNKEREELVNGGNEEIVGIIQNKRKVFERLSQNYFRKKPPELSLD